MRILISWTGSRREPHLFRAGMLLPGTHLQVLRDSPYSGRFEYHYLLSVPETLDDAQQIVEELRKLPRAPLTEVKVVQLLDPTDHNEIAGALFGALRDIDKEHGLLRNELWVLLNTGTPQMQSVWLLLAQMGLVVARFIQSSPEDLARHSGTPPVRELVPDFSRWRELFSTRAPSSRA
jgi:sigma54-dependent transcription regulator